MYCFQSFKIKLWSHSVWTNSLYARNIIKRSTCRSCSWFSFEGVSWALFYCSAALVYMYSLLKVQYVLKLSTEYNAFLLWVYKHRLWRVWYILKLSTMRSCSEGTNIHFEQVQYVLKLSTMRSLSVGTYTLWKVWYIPRRNTWCSCSYC